MRLELFGLPGENRTLVVPVSEKAEVEGKCLEGNSEVSSMSRLLMLSWYQLLLMLSRKGLCDDVVSKTLLEASKPCLFTGEICMA